MNIKILSLLAAMLLVGTAFAQITEDMINQNMNNIVSTYNSNVDQVPEFVKAVIGNENLHIYFTNTAGQTMEFAVITRNGAIQEASVWQDKNSNKNHDAWDSRGTRATMAFYISEDIIRKIAESNDPLNAFKQAWGKEIKFEAIDFGANLKIILMNIGMFISRFFF